jgi:hypothetical protein
MVTVHSPNHLNIIGIPHMDFKSLRFHTWPHCCVICRHITNSTVTVPLTIWTGHLNSTPLTIWTSSEYCTWISSHRDSTHGLTVVSFTGTSRILLSLSSISSSSEGMWVDDRHTPIYGAWEGHCTIYSFRIRLFNTIWHPRPGDDTRSWPSWSNQLQYQTSDGKFAMPLVNDLEAWGLRARQECDKVRESGVYGRYIHQDSPLVGQWWASCFWPPLILLIVVSFQFLPLPSFPYTIHLSMSV